MDSECKGFLYLMKKALHFMPQKEFSCYRRGVISSQRIEMTNACLKKNGSKIIDMLHQAFVISTNWFTEGKIIKYKNNQVITFKAQELIDEMFLRGAKKEYHKECHVIQKASKCCCCVLEDVGIPCPAMTFEILRNNGEILPYLSHEWLVETHKAAFKAENSVETTMNNVIIQRNVSTNQTSELVAAKIKWVYENSLDYKIKIDELLENASNDMQIPFFEISNKKKKKQTKRYKSSIEETKSLYACRDALQKYIPGKITLNNMITFANSLCKTNNNLPKFNHNWSKKEMYNWFQKNWNEIAKSLSV